MFTASGIFGTIRRQRKRMLCIVYHRENDLKKDFYRRPIKCAAVVARQSLSFSACSDAHFTAACSVEKDEGNNY